MSDSTKCSAYAERPQLAFALLALAVACGKSSTAEPPTPSAPIVETPPTPTQSATALPSATPSAPTKKDCSAPGACGPRMGMPNKTCADGSTAGPGACVPTPDGTRCGWEVRVCPEDAARARPKPSPSGARPGF